MSDVRGQEIIGDTFVLVTVGFQPDNHQFPD